MPNTFTVDKSAAPRRGLLSKLQLQFVITAVVLAAGWYLISRPTTVKISSETRSEGLATIVWVLYDEMPKFAYIYGAPREFDKVLRGSSTNSRGELRLRHGTVEGELVAIASDDATGPITIDGHKYEMSRGRTFTIDLQHTGAVVQYDVEVPLPKEPASAEKPYRFDIPNAEIMQFIRKAQAGG